MRRLAVVGSWALAMFCGTALAATGELPSAEQALKQYLPIHRDVDIDRPDAAEAARCKISARKVDGKTAVVIESPEGMTLRLFVDADGNGVVDQWRYFKDGLEVYRDIDSNGNNRADQYRWFHGAGSRWGIDRDENGTVDYWKMISAEEASAEIVAALAEKDAARFMRAALSPAELKSLGLGAEKTKSLEERLGGLEEQFQRLAAQQRVVGPATKWVQFSAGRPGTVPAGTNGSTSDLQVYENVVAITETEGANGQVEIGTLVKVGETWRAIGLPVPVEEGQNEIADSGEFFNKPPVVRQPEMPSGGPSEELQAALAQLQEMDEKAGTIPEGPARSQYHQARANLLQEIAAKSTSAEEQSLWIHQLADSVSAAVQSGEYPAGVQRLDALLASLNGKNPDIEAYVTFRKLSAEYGLKMQNTGAMDFAKVHQEWLENLRQFAESYPNSPDTAEAMLQLAMAHEFAGEEDKAKEWYGQIVTKFPDSSQARKATGARTRLDSVGNVIRFRGQSPAGETVDLAGYRGKVVVIQYWASWCEPCKADMAALKDLAIRYGKSGFQVLGVNVDSTLEEMKSYLTQNPLPWQQIHEQGGLDSRPANELGIHTLPTMILVDQGGKVVNRNIHVAELDSELRKLIR